MQIGDQVYAFTLNRLIVNSLQLLFCTDRPLFFICQPTATELMRETEPE